MNYPLLKICGLTRMQDISAINRLSVHYAGFIFAKLSPRRVTVAQAKRLISELDPRVNAVGVFMDSDVATVTKASGAIRASHVQLHGAYKRAHIKALQSAGLKVIQVYHVNSASDWNNVKASNADFVMIDNRGSDGGGGTGKTFNWSLKPPHRIANLILSGGMNSANLADGISAFNPAIVDVNSSVETRPGEKSARKLNELVAAYTKAIVR